MSDQWDENRLRREVRGAVRDVAKRSGCTLKSMDVELVTPAERAEALAKASKYRRLSEQVADRDTSDGYRQLAKQALQKAGLA